MYDIIILGAGGMGRETCEVAEDAFANNPDYQIKGFLSDVLDVLDGFEDYPPLLGTIKDYEIQPNDRFILAIGDVEGRRKVAENILERGGEFVNLIHPMAKVDKRVELGRGVIIFPFCHVGANAKLGDFTLLNLHATIGHDVILGQFSELAPFSVLGGATVTGEECYFGMHASVAQKVKLGTRVVISQGSVTQKDQPDDVLILGVPGKTLRKIGMS